LNGATASSGYSTAQRTVFFSTVLCEAWFDRRMVGSMYFFKLEGVLFFFVLNFVVSTPSNNSLNATSPANGPYCVALRQFLRPDLLPKHCIAAAVQFLHDEAAEYQYKPIEFLMPGAEPLSSMETQTTPRRYVYCKLGRPASHTIPVFVGRVRTRQL